MSLPLTSPTFLVAALNALIIVMLAIIGVITQSPLVILGLLMLQNVPIVQYDKEDEEEEEDEEEAGMPIGFLSKVKS